MAACCGVDARLGLIAEAKILYVKSTAPSFWPGVVPDTGADFARRASPVARLRPDRLAIHYRLGRIVHRRPIMTRRLSGVPSFAETLAAR
jgi:hypothetical protein